MFVEAHKLKRDYKIIYQYDVDRDCSYYGETFTMIIKDCFTYDEAYERFCDTEPYRCIEIDIEAVGMTKQQYVNAEVYELVLAELFDGPIAVYGWLDDNADTWEINPDLQGLEKLMVEHQAYIKYNKMKGL